MTRILKYFMWGYQEYFQSHAQGAAEELAKLLDPALAPTMGLVGFLATPTEGSRPVCVEPQDWLFQPPVFTTVLADAEAIVKRDTDPMTFYSLPEGEALAKRRIRNRALREAIAAAVERSGLDEQRKHFVAGPVRVEPYDVYLVLGLRKATLDAHPRLRQGVRDRLPVHTSLLHAAVQQLFADLCRDLRQPDAGSDLSSGRSAREHLRAAGRDLMATPCAATRAHEGMYAFFDRCDQIAATPYEGSAARGNLLVAAKDHPNASVSVTFSRPVPLRQTRRVRKLLCLAQQDGEYLLTDGNAVHGLATLTGSYDGASEDLFVVRFAGLLNWELAHAGQVLMTVRHGEPRLPKAPISKAKVVGDLRRAFARDGTLDADRVWSLVEHAVTAPHGTTLVFSAAASSEASRLAAQATPVQPFAMTPDRLDSLAAIDGAVLMDPAGVCHALGVILDGTATSSGDPGRGSRYNSALRYRQSQALPSYVVVVSEDRTVDLRREAPRP